MVESTSDNNKNENKNFEEGTDIKSRPAPAKRTKSIVKNDNNASISVKTSDPNTSHSFPARTKIIEPHAKNFNGWEMVSVELSALRDIIPRIRHEICSYTISECQFVRELEKKLPATRSSGEVRLQLVMEQIERLRMHRRSALDELSRSIVRIAELQSKKERASYDAGELYWNTRLNELENRYYASMSPSMSAGTGPSIATGSMQSDEMLPQRMPPTHSTSLSHSLPRDSPFALRAEHREFVRAVDEKEKGSGDNDNDGRGTMQARSTSSTALAESRNPNNKNASTVDQYNDRTARRHQDAATNISASASAGSATRELRSPSQQSPGVSESGSLVDVGNENGQVMKADADVLGPSAIPSNQAAINYLGELLKGKSGTSVQENADSTDASGVKIHAFEADQSEIDMIISEAKQQISTDKNKLKKLLWVSGISIAAMAGLVLLEMQTHIISNLIGNFAR